MTIDPYKYYIDRRKGIDVTETELHYTGAAWIERGCDVEFLREVIINEYGVFIEVSDDGPSILPSSVNGVLR